MSLSHVWLCNPMDWGCQTLRSMGFPRQEYWSELSFPFPEDLPDPGVKLGPPVLQANSLPSEPPGHFALTLGKWQHSCQKRQLMSLVLLVPSMKEKGPALPALFVPTSLACSRVSTRLTLPIFDVCSLGLGEKNGLLWCSNQSCQRTLCFRRQMSNLTDHQESWHLESH